MTECIADNTEYSISHQHLILVLCIAFPRADIVDKDCPQVVDRPLRYLLLMIQKKIQHISHLAEYVLWFHYEALQMTLPMKKDFVRSQKQGMLPECALDLSSFVWLQ